jgi:hypothetical protein
LLKLRSVDSTSALSDNPFPQAVDATNVTSLSISRFAWTVKHRYRSGACPEYGYHLWPSFLPGPPLNPDDLKAMLDRISIAIGVHGFPDF